MLPTKQLIRGLRETAKVLRNGADYEWSDAERCNCGLLAQALLNVDESGLRRLRAVPDADGFNLDGCWTHAALSGHCRQTGLPTHTVFKALAACGVEYEDYKRIEYLDNVAANFDEPANVAAWMDAEADRLEARRAAGERPERLSASDALERGTP